MLNIRDLAAPSAALKTVGLAAEQEG